MRKKVPKRAAERNTLRKESQNEPRKGVLCAKSPKTSRRKEHFAESTPKRAAERDTLQKESQNEPRKGTLYRKSPQTSRGKGYFEESAPKRGSERDSILEKYSQAHLVRSLFFQWMRLSRCLLGLLCRRPSWRGYSRTLRCARSPYSRRSEGVSRPDRCSTWRGWLLIFGGGAR